MKSEEIKMIVNIGGERISLSVPFSRQEAVRKTESELSALLRSWGEKFPGKSPKELLAMVAYKFASSYFDILEMQAHDAENAQSLLVEADRLCRNLSPDESDEDDFPLY